MCHDFGESKVRCFDIEVTLDDLEIWRNLTEEIVGFFVG